MVGAFVEAGDHWQLPMAHRMVTQCRLDYAFTLVVADDPAGSFEIRIERPFAVHHGGHEIVLDPEGESEAMAPALAFLRREVERAIAFKDGRLQLCFVGGGALRVPADEEYEAWSIVGPAGLRVVSMPGGELAVWSPEVCDGSG